MLCAYTKENASVLATEAHKNDGPFHCPECETELILKQGRVKIAHFAHLPNTDCSYAGEPESETHIETKLEIYKALQLQPGVSKLQVERYLKEVRPDISFCFEQRYIALEIQISPLSFDELIRRTAAYTKKNIYVLWMPILSLEMFSGRYAPKEWERDLSSLYNGIVYYWSHGLDLVPVEFEKYMLTPGRYSSWSEKASKRYVSPKMLPAVSILKLSPLRQPKRFPYPAARLWGLPVDDASA